MRLFNINLNLRLAIRVFLIALVATPLLFSIFSVLKPTTSPIKNAELISPQKDFSATQTVNFKLVLELDERKKTSFIPKAYAEDEPQITTTLLDPMGDKTDTAIDIKRMSNTSYDITISPPNSFKPGQYRLIAEIEAGDDRKKLTQDFSWGVLALNPDKAVYRPGEKAQIDMAVLDEKGLMVCDAEVILELTLPDGSKKVRTTSDGTIKVNDVCHSKDFTLTPDYETNFVFENEGEHILTLTSKTNNGTFMIADVITVEKEIEFDVKRVSATRLYPLNQYPMTLTVKPTIDFKGTVTETLPASFAILSSKQEGKNTDYAAVVTEEKDTKKISWEVDWKKGNTYTLSYIYDAPNISPEFYLIGNLTFSHQQPTTNNQSPIFAEQRFWQLANDAVGIVVPDGDVAVSENFAVCTTNGNGSCRFGVVDENPTEITGDYVSTGTANDDGTGGDEEEFTMTSAGGSLATVTNVDVKFQAQIVGGCQGSGGSPCDSLGVRIFIDGGYVTPQTQAVDGTDTLYTLSFPGTWTGDDDLQLEFVRTINGGGSSGSRDDDVRIYQIWAEVTYTTIDVSGNVYNQGTSNALTECDGDSGTHELSLRTNSSTYTTSCSSADGSYTFTGVVPGGSGSGMVVWIDDAQAPETDGALVIRYDGSGNSTSNIFYDDTVTVTSDDTNPVTILHMDTFDNADDGDIPYTATDAGTDTLVVNSGYELLVKIKSGVTSGSDVFDPGGTVTTNATGGNLHIDDNSDAYLDTATSSIGADITIDSGATLNIDADTTVGGGDITATGTLTTTSGSPTLTVRGTGNISGAGTKTVYNLTIGDGTTATTTLTGVLTANNDVSVGTGSTFNVNSTLNINGGDFTTTTTGIVNTTSGTPTVTVAGTGNIGPGSGGSFTLYDLTIDGTQTLSGAVILNNDLDINTGDSLALNSQNLNISGGDLTTTGTGTVTCSGCSGGTLTISGTGNLGTSGTITAYNIAITGTQTLGATVTANNDMSVAGGASLALNSQNLNVNGGDLTTATSGTITCAGCSGGTVTISGTGNVGGGTTGAITFYNLATTGTGTTTFTNGGSNTVSNNLTVGSGTTLNLNSNITITGNLTNTTTGIISTSGGIPTVTVQGTTLGGGSGDITFYNLEKSGAGTTTFSGSGTNTINNNLTVSAGTLTQSSPLTVTNDVSVATGTTFNTTATLNINGGDLTTTGTGIVNTTGGTGTTTLSGSGNIGGGGTVTVYNLALSGAGTHTLQSATTATNDISIGTGQTLALNNQNLTANGGDITTTTTGTISCSACSGGTVTLGAGGNFGAGAGGSITVYDLQTSGTGTTTLTSDITVNNDATVGTGKTLALNSRSLSIAGGDLNTTGTGQVTCSACSGGTLTMTGTGNLGTSGSITAYNLAVNGSQTAGATITANNSLTVGSSGTFTMSGQNINSGGNFTNITTGIIVCSGTTGTVTMTAGGSLGGGSGAITFCNLATSTTGTTFFSGGGTNTVNNNISVGAGTTLNLNSNISVAGSLSNTTSGIISYSSGTPTVSMTGTGSIGGGTTGAITFYNLNTSGTGTISFANSGTNTIDNNISVGSGTTLNLNSNIAITGNITKTTTGIIGTSAGSPTVTVNGTTIGGGSGAITFHNLTTANAGTTTFSGSGTNTINNNLSITNGVFSQSSPLTVTGDISVGAGATYSVGNTLAVNGGAFTTTSTGSVTYSGTPTVTISGTGNIGGGSGSIDFYNLTCNGAQTAASPIDVNRTLTVGGSGSLNMQTNDLVVGTSGVTNSGSIANSGTISQSSAGTTTILSSSGGTASIGGSGSTTFYNLNIAPTVASAPTITLGTAGSQTINVTNSFTIGNGSNNVNVSGATNDPTLNVDGDFTVSSTGNFTSTGGTLFVAGNFANNGTFSNDSGTVEIDGSGTSILSGTGSPAVTFHNLTATTASKELNFTQNQTFRVNGLLNLDNQTIDSTTTTRWFINHQGTESVTNTTITNSGCDGSSTLITVDTTDTNGGNNGSCWDFASVIYPNPVRVRGTNRIRGNVRIVD